MKMRQCPFCGRSSGRIDFSVVKTDKLPDGESVRVMCRCGAMSPSADTTENAFRRWEDRAPAEESPTKSPNTGSPKLPSSEEVWNHVNNLIEFNDDYARTEEARMVSKLVYEFITRQLRAGA